MSVKVCRRADRRRTANNRKGPERELLVPLKPREPIFGAEAPTGHEHIIQAATDSPAKHGFVRAGGEAWSRANRNECSCRLQIGPGAATRCVNQGAVKCPADAAAQRALPVIANRECIARDERSNRSINGYAIAQAGG